MDASPPSLGSIPVSVTIPSSLSIPGGSSSSGGNDAVEKLASDHAAAVPDLKREGFKGINLESPVIKGHPTELAGMSKETLTMLHEKLQKHREEMLEVPSDELDRHGKRRLCKAWAFYNECTPREDLETNIPREYRVDVVCPHECMLVKQGMLQSSRMSLMDVAILNPPNAKNLVADPEGLRHLATLVDWRRTSNDVWGIKKSSSESTMFTLRGSNSPVDLVLSALSAARIEQLPGALDDLDLFRRNFCKIQDGELLDLVRRLHAQLRLSLPGVPYRNEILQALDGMDARTYGRKSPEAEVGRLPPGDREHDRYGGRVYASAADQEEAWHDSSLARLAVACIAGIALGGYGVAYMSRIERPGGRRKARGGRR